MFTSTICKHTFKWGKNKGNICGRPSKKKDSRCHKHRYRFIRFLTNIYKSFKYLFEIKPIVIKNKKQIKKILEQEEKEKFRIDLENEEKLHSENLKKNENETFFEYVNRIDGYTNGLLKTKDSKIVGKIIMSNLYKNLKPYKFGSKEWADNSNHILRIIQRKYNFF